MFQSTHLHEVRHWRLAGAAGNRPVSIHAPARGATAIYRIPLRLLQFQSTHLHEVRLNFINDDKVLAKFQSTHLHEVRRKVFPQHLDRVRFNPRTCTRCDSEHFSLRSKPFGFNPRTCTRCDSPQHLHVYLSLLFQSTHLHEVRQRFLADYCLFCNNHTLSQPDLAMET